MRLLFVVGSYPPSPCGVGDYTEKLANSFSRNNSIRIGVLTNANTHREYRDDCDVIGTPADWSIKSFFVIIQSIRDWRADLIHFQFPSQAFLGKRWVSWLPIICKIMGKRVVLTWHEPYTWRSAHHFLLQRMGASAVIYVRSNFFKLLPRAFVKLLKNIPTKFIPNASAIPISALSAEERNNFRVQALKGRRRLLVFFGFIYPFKGVEQIFEIGDPANDLVVVIGQIQSEDYRAKLEEVIKANAWPQSSVIFLGFQAPDVVAQWLACADAVLLPFLDGGGTWNTSLHSALAQGTLVISTAIPARGYEADRNLYTAQPGDIQDMKKALDQFSGRRVPVTHADGEWSLIAQKHHELYANLMLK